MSTLIYWVVFCSTIFVSRDKAVNWFNCLIIPANYSINYSWSQKIKHCLVHAIHGLVSIFIWHWNFEPIPFIFLLQMVYQFCNNFRENKRFLTSHNYFPDPPIVKKNWRLVNHVFNILYNIVVADKRIFEAFKNVFTSTPGSLGRECRLIYCFCTALPARMEVLILNMLMKDILISCKIIILKIILELGNDRVSGL